LTRTLTVSGTFDSHCKPSCKAKIIVHTLSVAVYTLGMFMKILRRRPWYNMHTRMFPERSVFSCRSLY